MRNGPNAKPKCYFMSQLARLSNNKSFICKKKIFHLQECLEIEGFDLFISKHYDDPDTRGVVIYVKTGINAQVIEVENYEYKDSLWIRIPTSGGVK